MLSHKKIAPVLLATITSVIVSFSMLHADVRKIGPANPDKLRIRVGDNSHNNINKVIFNVPGQDQLGNGTPVASTNNIYGGSGAYTVRVVMDNRRPPTGTAKLYADTSSNMTCVTAASCDGTSIAFSKISWDRRDGDNFDLANSFNNSSTQLLHQQTVTSSDPADPRTGYRYRDYIRFKFANDIFLPAGTYRGRVNFKAKYPD